MTNGVKQWLHQIAQPKARGLKAGDQWALSICRPHHRELHARGNEWLFWRIYTLDPLAIAVRLWLESQAVCGPHH